jgi:hypothetical protein
MSLKKPVTPPAIDPGTVRPVAQRLNHYATPGPNIHQDFFIVTNTQTKNDVSEATWYNTGGGKQLLVL